MDECQLGVLLFSQRQGVLQRAKRRIGEVDGAEDPGEQFLRDRDDVCHRRGHRENGTGGLVNDLFGDRSEHEPLKARTAVCAHDDEIARKRGRALENLPGGVAFTDLKPHRDRQADLGFHEALHRREEGIQIARRRYRHRHHRCPGCIGRRRDKRTDVEDGNRRPVASGNRHRVIERVPGEVRKVDRAENVSNLDHDCTRCSRAKS